MRVVIDRFEGDFAVCEADDGKLLNIEKSRLPGNVHEGDVLLVTDGNIVYDVLETEKRKREIEELVRDLWR